MSVSRQSVSAADRSSAASGGTLPFSSKKTTREAASSLAGSNFDLPQAKAKIQRLFEESAPGKFKKFFHSPVFDKLTQILVLFFVARFHHETLCQAVDKAKRQHLEGLKTTLVAAKLEELEKEAEKQIRELAPLYCHLLLAHATHAQGHQDQLFFESLYEALIGILCEAFSVSKRKEEIEVQVGFLFRTPAFNLYSRKNNPARSIDTLSLRELHALKAETTNRALNAKLLSSLYEREEHIAVQSLAGTNSLLVTKCVASPLVARNNPASKKSMHGKDADVDKLAVSMGGTWRRGSQAMSTLPVHVEPSGMVTDDSMIELEALRRMFSGVGKQGSEVGSRGSMQVTDSFQGRTGFRQQGSIKHDLPGGAGLAGLPALLSLSK